MATLATALPRPRTKRPRYQPAAGRNRFLEIYFFKHIDNSQLRREVDTARRRECLSLLGSGVLVFLFGLLFAWQHFRCVRLGYQVEQLKAQRTAMEGWNHELRLEQASLADPQRIDYLARRHLGLNSPEPEQVIPVEGTAPAPSSAAEPEVARNFSSSDHDSSGEP